MVEYETAVDFWKFQCETQWRQFGAFVLPHTLLMAFLLQQWFAEKPSPRGVSSMAGAGLALSLLWFVVHMRAVSLSKFRMEKAKLYEQDLEEYDFFTGDAKQFADGREVVVGGVRCQMPWCTRVRVSIWTTILIIIFGVMYSVILIWGLCNVQ